MKKPLIAFVFIWAMTFASQAQDGSLSPYSYYGYGDPLDPQSVENAAMGHLNFYADTIHYNFLLPSSLGYLKYVNYAVASTQNFYRLQDQNSRFTGSAFLTPYIALGIPFGKAGIGIGFKPYSTSGYLIKRTFNAQNIAKTGEGGMNQFFFQAAYRPLKDWSIGAGFEQYFGNKLARIIHARDSLKTMTKQIDDAFFYGHTFRVSTHYTLHLPQDWYIQSGLLYRFQGRIHSQNNSTLQLLDYSYGVTRVVRQRILRQDTTELIMPRKVSLGLGVGRGNKWFIGAEWEKTYFGDYTNDFFSTPFARFQDAVNFKVGGFWNPEHRIYSTYWKRITYRAGFFQQKGFLNLRGRSIDQFGTTFGMSLPMGRYLSNVNVDFEYIKRGTTDNGLVKENIFKIKIGLSFNDKWFIKRKIK